MYAKFELIAVLHKTDENKREEFSWLAVAMTPEEVDILKKEASYVFLNFKIFYYVLVDARISIR